MVQMMNEPITGGAHPVRRFLVVGCGGSGGATLAYLMDQLRSDLAALGIPRLPRGWQFVHIDVPLEVEGGPSGLGNVPEQGGSYLGLGFTGGTSVDVDKVVSERLAGKRALGTTATWTAQDPSRNPVPVVSGAGQFREIGRMLTLNKLGEVRQGLRAALDRLHTPEADSDMAEMQPLGGVAQNTTPLVLVLSSMAGGAGASMALDVCRVLSSFRDLDTKLTGVFMFGADIFQGLSADRRSGVNANALAMLGEIVATQTGAGASADAEMYQALGVADGAMTDVPFGRVFPVGMYKGKGGTVRFGDGTPGSIYRGLARGLAGLMESPTATHEYIAYDLTNTGGAQLNANRFGWGALDSAVVWGSFGFSSLSMGRDRYAEYAAQRLARGAVDKLLDGHLRPGATETGREQLTALVGSQLPAVLRTLKLDAPRDKFARWLTDTLWARDAIVREASVVVQENVTLPSADQQAAGQWRERLMSVLRDATARLTGDAHQRAYAWASAYQRQLFTDTLSAFEKAVARFGVIYAADLAREVRRTLEQNLVPAARAYAEKNPGRIDELSSASTAMLAALQHMIQGNRPTEAVQEDLAENVSRFMSREAARLLAELWSDYSGNVLGPLEKSLNERGEALTLARRATGRAAGLAFLATEHYPDWPTEESLIPARFTEASNEVLITGPEVYHERFHADVQNAADAAGSTYGEARQVVLSNIIEGEWPFAGAEVPPRDLLQVTGHWQPQALAVDPRSNDIRVASPASFDVKARPREVLARARALVRRSNYSFATFCQESLRSYVNALHESESEAARRRADIKIKFEAALGLALPLAAPNVALAREIHYMEDVRYRFKFSAVPFQDTPVATDLARVVANNPDFDTQFVQQNLDGALNASDQAMRIDVFGSYANLAPVCFGSVLQPAVREWGALQGDREPWWRGRRARPLPGGLPASDHERRAMVAGWFVGQMVGKIQLPKPADRDVPVMVFDREVDRWVGFPHPLLTPYRRFRHAVDWLPHVLESMVMAAGAAYQSPIFESLRPYRALRRLFDADPQGPSPRGINLALQAQHELAEWFAHGDRSDNPSTIKGAAEATSISQRAELARGYVTQWRAQNEGFFLPVSAGGRPGAQFGEITDRRVGAQSPLMRDLAPDVQWALTEIAALIDPAVAEAERLATGGSGAAFTPVTIEGLELT